MIAKLNIMNLSSKKARFTKQLLEIPLNLNIINLAGNAIKVIQSEKPDIPESNYLYVITPNPNGYVWLMPSNNYEDDVDILSNVIWTVN